MVIKMEYYNKLMLAYKSGELRKNTRFIYELCYKIYKIML